MNSSLECIAAVVVSHNRLSKLKHTLSILLREELDHVVVIDNASTDGTGQFLDQQSDARLCIISLPNNIGGAGGFELGMRKAMESFSPDWLLVLDDDAYPYPRALSAFRSLDKRDCDVLAGAVYLPDGSIAEMNRPWRNPFSTLSQFIGSVMGGRAAFHIADVAYEEHQMTSIHGASFVGMFLARNVLETHGYPDGNLFIYGDDVLYSLSLSNLGVKMGFQPKVKFEHDCRTVQAKGLFAPKWKNYYRFRNQIWVYRMAAGPFLAIPIVGIQIAKWIALSLTSSRNDRRSLLRILGLAVKDAFQGRTSRTHREILAFCEGTTVQLSE